MSLEPQAVALIVEDEPSIRRFVRLGLEGEGWQVHEAETVRQGLIDAGTRRPDLIILDLGLPDDDGLNYLKDLRAWSGVPVIVLSARSGEADKIAALDAGADDYLSKPFHMEELLARLRALIRRAGGHASALLSCGPLELDTRSARISLQGQPLLLTAQEFKLLAYLIHHAGQLVSRTELTEHLYAQDCERDSNTIEVFIGRLRKKLPTGLIETVRGMGYRLQAPDGTGR